ncbi:MAG TPA: serpin family protein, partial [Herpetosiphonaceae bacterium]|nr:serpin family protein [Herpetosiphonaceae bacterium]
NNPGAARDAINAWVDAQTAGEIKDLLPENSVTRDSRLVLVNAITFKAAWIDEFDPGSLTGDSTFRLADGGSVEADMMSRDEGGGYLHADIYDAADIAYKGSKQSMIIVMPKEGRFAEVERRLSRDFLDHLVESFNYGGLALTMPKFKYSATLELADTLAAMGSPDAFSAQADFSRIDGTTNLVVDQVVHEAVVDVDERGTEAAAATGATLKQIGGALEHSTLTVNRPFIFLIRDTRTGSILFLGRVMDPTR